MFKLYMRSYRAQCRWIAAHPVQYVVLNVVLIGALVGFSAWYEKAQDKRERQLAREVYDFTRQQNELRDAARDYRRFNQAFTPERTKEHIV